MQELSYSKAGPEECWLWKNSLDPDGYGRKHGTSAHRWMYDQEIGKIPKGHAVVHSCKIKHCVNPKHLKAIPLGAVARRASTTKLTMTIARKIRKYQEFPRKKTQQEVGLMFGINDSTVACIWAGTLWAEQPDFPV